MKSGWQTSEFWLTLTANVLAFAVAFGIVPIGDKETVQGAATQIITGVFGLLAGAAVLWKYIEARKTLKVAAMDAAIDERIDSLDRHASEAYAMIPIDVRKEANSVGMPILTLIILAFQNRDNIAKLIEAIRNWRKPA